MLRTRIKTAIMAVAIAAWFLGHTWRGLLVYFQGDDTMNMYWAWTLSLPKLLLANLTPFSYVYRPTGAVFYRVLYAAAGFHPAPFRAVCYGLLLLNIWLAFRFAKLLTGSTEIALLAALLSSYHNHLMDLYQNDGTVYDILCFTFFCAALCCYLAARANGNALRGPPLFFFLAFSVLALNSKEMALTLPAVLWAYELIYWGPASWKPRISVPWLFAGKLVVWLVTVSVPIAMLIKTSSKSVFTNVPDYAVSLSAGQFLKTTRSWLSQLFFLPDGAVSTPGVLLVLLAVVAAASWSSRKHMQFCAVLILILPLPANFITLRNFFVMYIPLLAWAVFIAALLVEVRDRLWRTPGAFWQFRQAGLFVLVALGLWAAQRADSFRSFDWIDPSQTALQSLRAGLQSCASVGRDGKVLLSADPFDKDDWAPVFATRLIFHSPEMVVDRVRPGSEKPPSEKYDCVLEYDQGSFRASLGN